MSSSSAITSPRLLHSFRDAACEVILPAGAVGSPHVLQLSDVGEPETLSNAGIPVHHALPGVGRNFQDHYNCSSGVK
jgi:choline dehydrogenase-like flavoprotein